MRTVRVDGVRSAVRDPQSVVVERVSTEEVTRSDRVVEVQWTGDDYAHGGRHDRRRLQELVDGAWVDLLVAAWTASVRGTEHPGTWQERLEQPDHHGHDDYRDDDLLHRGVDRQELRDVEEQAHDDERDDEG